MADGDGGGEAAGERVARLYGLLRPHLDERQRRLRLRAPGGGRKKLAATDPGLAPALRALVDPATRGDPVSPLRWTCLSTRNLAGTLAKAGHRCSAPVVARLLKAEGYSLQGNAKVAEGAQHADRDAQFRYISARAGEFLGAGDPVVSVDAKKKETAPRGALPYP